HTRHGLLTNNSAMVLYGLSAVLPGPTLPGIIRDFDLTLAQGGLIGSLQSAGGIVGVLATMWFADKVSRPWVAVLSFGLLSLAYLAVGFAPSYLALLLGFAATGLFIRVLDVMLNAHTGTLAPANSGRAMSTLHMFFSVGAFVGPIVALSLMRLGSTWSQIYLFVGVAYIGVMVLGTPWLRGYVRAAESPETALPPADATGSGSPESGAVAQDARSAPSQAGTIVILGGLLLFYAVHQIGLTSWIPHFLETARGAGPDLASFGLSAYWVGIIAGRYITGRIVDRFGAGRLLAWGCLGAAILSAIGALSPWVILAEIAYALAGLASGATIPLAYSVGYQRLPGRKGTVTALMSLLMMSGRFAGPWLIGAVADARGLVFAMLIPAVVLGVSGVLSIVLTRSVRVSPL
ncbi:MAG: MFS transporter, partial [Syntrophobacterales bacterium]